MQQFLVNVVAAFNVVVLCCFSHFVAVVCLTLDCVVFTLQVGCGSSAVVFQVVDRLMYYDEHPSLVAELVTPYTLSANVTHRIAQWAQSVRIPGIVAMQFPTFLQ